MNYKGGTAPAKLLALAAFVATSTPVGAATIIQTDSELRGRIGFARFDPTLGVLNSARLEVAASSQRSLLVIDSSGAGEPVRISYEIDGAFEIFSSNLRFSIPITGSGSALVDLSSSRFAFFDTFASGNAAFDLAPDFVQGPSSDMFRFTFFNADRGFFDPTLDTSVEAPDTVDVFAPGEGCAFGRGTTFCSDARLTLTYNFTPFSSAVPEPATWAMMIGGFGMVGGAMRSARRKRKVSVSYA